MVPEEGKVPLQGRAWYGGGVVLEGKVPLPGRAWQGECGGGTLVLLRGHGEAWQREEHWTLDMCDSEREGEEEGEGIWWNCAFCVFC